MCITAFCITPSWPPFSVSVRLTENRLTEIIPSFDVNVEHNQSGMTNYHYGPQQGHNRPQTDHNEPVTDHNEATTRPQLTKSDHNNEKTA